jgi:glycosyltransferase involved in cell wall biosynthesis
LVSTGRIEAEVVAPVPWFPFHGRSFGEYGAMARTPREEIRQGIRVHHPRYVAIPKVGSSIHPTTLAWCGRRELARLIAAGLSFHAIDAHYFYPDGVAAASLARHFGLPLVVTARGSDINLIAQFERPRKMILDAARQAHAVIAVSRALATAMIGLGIDPARIVVLRNGVDCAAFEPRARSAARLELGISAERVVISIGNLVPEKGHDLVVGALPALPGVQLIIVGEGAMRGQLETLAEQAGVANRVRILDVMPQQSLASVYSAADVLVLASTREGWPNVLLEAMACGTPVVATDVGGVREIVSTHDVGEVLSERTPQSIVAAVRRIFARQLDRGATRLHAEQFGWDVISKGQLEVFSSLLPR